MASPFANVLGTILKNQQAITGLIGLTPGSSQISALQQSIQGQIEALERLPQTPDLESQIAMLESELAKLEAQ